MFSSVLFPDPYTLMPVAMQLVQYLLIATAAALTLVADDKSCLENLSSLKD